MPHIKLDEELPGIRSLVAFRPDTGKYLYELAQVLLQDPSPLRKADRELIAAYVSSRNECTFCTESHAAAARVHFGRNSKIVDQVIDGLSFKDISPKMMALLTIAGKVQVNGKEVLPADIENARKEGADDREIHDTVLIAAAFSMFNRYVDGLATWSPSDPIVFQEMGIKMATKGYSLPSINK